MLEIKKVTWTFGVRKKRILWYISWVLTISDCCLIKKGMLIGNKGRNSRRNPLLRRRTDSATRSTTPARRPRRAAPGQFLANFRQNVARFRLYRHRSLQANTRFAAFLKIYKIIKLKFLKFGKILQILQHFQNFCWNFTKITDFSNWFFAKFLRLQRCKRMQIL